MSVVIRLSPVAAGQIRPQLCPQSVHHGPARVVLGGPIGPELV